MNPLEQFLYWFENGGPSSDLALGTCGPNALIWWAVADADARLADPKTVGELLAAYSGVAPTVEAWCRPTEDRKMVDPALASRLRGFRVVLGVFLKAAARADLRKAAAEFEDGWVGPKPVFELDRNAPSVDDVLKEYRDDLALDRAGGWMVYDVLWHLHHSNPAGIAPVTAGGIRAREVTTVLGAGGDGRAFRLVAEVLPGPAGLVTPDWWPMGLVRFTRPSEPTGAEDVGDFVASTQSILTAAGSGAGGRIRWRLEPLRADASFGGTDLTGRSAEGAAACVGVAVCEPRDSPSEAHLNPAVAISATVTGTAPQHGARALGPVAAGTLRDKFEAADRAGVREVLLDSDQPGPVPPHPASYLVATVEDAYLEMCVTNKFVRAYREHVRAKFDAEWVEVETPPEEKRS